jgi:hypothetical protein
VLGGKVSREDVLIFMEQGKTPEFVRNDPGLWSQSSSVDGTGDFSRYNVRAETQNSCGALGRFATLCISVPSV